jgi:hypothetical protein
MHVSNIFHFNLRSFRMYDGQTCWLIQSRSTRVYSFWLALGYSTHNLVISDVLHPIIACYVITRIDTPQPLIIKNNERKHTVSTTHYRVTWPDVAAGEVIYDGTVPALRTVLVLVVGPLDPRSLILLLAQGFTHYLRYVGGYDVRLPWCPSLIIIITIDSRFRILIKLKLRERVSRLQVLNQYFLSVPRGTNSRWSSTYIR